MIHNRYTGNRCPQCHLYTLNYLSSYSSKCLACDFEVSWGPEETDEQPAPVAPTSGDGDAAIRRANEIDSAYGKVLLVISDLLNQKTITYDQHLDMLTKFDEMFSVVNFPRKVKPAATTEPGERKYRHQLCNECLTPLTDANRAKEMSTQCQSCYDAEHTRPAPDGGETADRVTVASHRGTTPRAGTIVQDATGEMTAADLCAVEGCGKVATHVSDLVYGDGVKAHYCDEHSLHERPIGTPEPPAASESEAGKE